VGGYKAEFTPDSVADDIVFEAAVGLEDQIESFLVPNANDLLPDEDAMEAMMAFDDQEALDALPDGFEETVKFGGYARMSWGCKVTFAKKDGKFSKVTECGGKGVKAMGKAPGEDEILFEEE